MGQIARKNLITAGCVLLAVIVCGWMGYSNRLEKVDSAPSVTVLTYSTPTTVSLAGCPQSKALCLESYGMDSTQNILFVLTNTAAPIPEIYITLQQQGQPAVFPCKKMQTESESFYCLGGPVFEGTMLSVLVFNKSTDKLLGHVDIDSLSGVGVVIPAISEPNLLQDTPTPGTIILLETTPDLAIPFPTAQVLIPIP